MSSVLEYWSGRRNCASSDSEYIDHWHILVLILKKEDTNEYLDI